MFFLLPFAMCSFAHMNCFFFFPGKRKRSTADLGMVLEHMREEVERFAAVSEGNVGRLVEEMRLARETETELRRQELEQEKDFNESFLAVFRNLVQAVANKDN